MNYIDVLKEVEAELEAEGFVDEAEDEDLCDEDEYSDDEDEFLLNSEE